MVALGFRRGVYIFYSQKWCAKRYCDIGSTIWKCAEFKYSPTYARTRWHLHRWQIRQRKFHRVNAPNQTELGILLYRVIQRVVRKLEREGLLILDPEQPWLDFGFHEPIDSLSAASTEASDRRYRIATGPHSGSRTLT